MFQKVTDQGLEQGWQFLLIVVVKVSIGGHQVEQVLIAGCSQLLGVLGRLGSQLGGENKVSIGSPGLLSPSKANPAPEWILSHY